MKAKKQNNENLMESNQIKKLKNISKKIDKSKTPSLTRYCSSKKFNSQNKKLKKLKIQEIKRPEINIEENCPISAVNKSRKYKKIKIKPNFRSDSKHTRFFTNINNYVRKKTPEQHNENNIIKNNELNSEINSNGLLIYKNETQESLSYDKTYINSPDNIYTPINVSNKNLQVNTLNINSNTNNIININNNISNKQYIMSPAYNKNLVKNDLCTKTSIFRGKKTKSTISNQSQGTGDGFENVFYSTVTGAKNKSENRYENNEYNSKPITSNKKKKYINKIINRNMTNFVYSNKFIKKDNTSNTNGESDITSKITNNISKSSDSLINIYKEKLLKIFIRFVNNYCVEYSKNFYSDFFYGLKNYIYKKKFNLKKHQKKNLNDFHIKSFISKYDNYNSEDFNSYNSKKNDKKLNNQRETLGALLYTTTSSYKNMKGFNLTQKNICNNDNNSYKNLSNTLISNDKKIFQKTDSKMDKINQNRKIKSNTFNDIKINNDTITFNNTTNPCNIYNNIHKHKMLSSNKDNFKNKNRINSDLDYYDPNSLSNSHAKSNYHYSCEKPNKNPIYKIDNNNDKNILNNFKHNNCIIEKFVYKKGELNDKVIKENTNEIIKNKNGAFYTYKKSKDNFIKIKKIKNKKSEKINNKSSINMNIREEIKENNNNFYLGDLDKPLGTMYLKNNSYLNTANNKENEIKRKKISFKNVKDFISSDHLLFIHINYVYFNGKKKIKKKKIRNKNPIMSFNQKYFRIYNLYSFNILGKKKKYLYINNPIDENIEYDENNKNNEDEEERDIPLNFNNFIKNKKIKHFILKLENIINKRTFEYKILFINLIKKVKFLSIIYNIWENRKNDILKKYFNIYKNKIINQRTKGLEIEDIDSDFDDNDFIIDNIDNNVMNEEDIDHIDNDYNYDNNFCEEHNDVKKNNMNDKRQFKWKPINYNGKQNIRKNTNKIYAKKKIKSNKKNKNNNILSIEDEKVYYKNKFEEFIELFRLELINFTLLLKKNK